MVAFPLTGSNPPEAFRNFVLHGVMIAPLRAGVASKKASFIHVDVAPPSFSPKVELTLAMV